MNDNKAKPMMFIEDKRVISAWTPDGNCGWTLGNNYCERIEVCDELSECGGYVPYLAIFMANGREFRANAKYFIIEFDSEKG